MVSSTWGALFETIFFSNHYITLHFHVLPSAREYNSSGGLRHASVSMARPGELNTLPWIALATHVFSAVLILSIGIFYPALQARSQLHWSVHQGCCCPSLRWHYPFWYRFPCEGSIWILYEHLLFGAECLVAPIAQLRSNLVQSSWKGTIAFLL